MSATACGSGLSQGKDFSTVTDSRTAVYDTLRTHPHASADDVFLAIVERMPRASRQSVYNALGDFADAGLVRRIEPAGRPMLFELRVSDNHHHLVCTSCGSVSDVTLSAAAERSLDKALRAAAGGAAFELQQHRVDLLGRCASCVAAAN